MRGAERKIAVHPLFLLLGVLSALTGRLLLFLAATVAALEHECAHAFAARRRGYELNKLVLMPYGAALKGDLAGIPPKDEIMVCLAGPLCSGLTALGFAALWWLYPETYPYTDMAAYVCLSLFLVNLLPAFPLDGGRILRALLRPLGQRKSVLVCRIVTAVTAAGIAGYFVWSCFSSPNWSALIFASFLLVGGFGGGEYRRLTFSRRKNFARGIEEKRIALSSDVTAGETLGFLREDRYLVLVLFKNGEFVGELPEEELLNALESGKYASPLSELI